MPYHFVHGAHPVSNGVRLVSQITHDLSADVRLGTAADSLRDTSENPRHATTYNLHSLFQARTDGRLMHGYLLCQCVFPAWLTILGADVPGSPRSRIPRLHIHLLSIDSVWLSRYYPHVHS